MTANPTAEARVQALGRQILDLMEGESPSIFKRDFWNGQIMDWSMKMPAFKVEMFRFVDVLPVLNDSTEVARHIQEYFCRPDQDFPSALQWGLKTLSPGSMMARLAASQIEKNVVSMARGFIAGQDAKDAQSTLKKMWKKDTAFTVDVLGEKTVSEAEADDYQRRYLELMEHLSAEVRDWKANPVLETDAWGAVPRVNISIKVSALYSQIDPSDHKRSIEVLSRRLRPLYERAQQLGVFLHLDTEHYEYKTLTFAVFKSLLTEPALATMPGGCVVQAYLRDSYEDTVDLINWARKHGKVITIRLVKGAYWDFETLHAQLEGWPVPVYTDKPETDWNYERITRLMLENIDVIRPAIASHNVRSLAYAIATAEQLGLPKNALEFQMLYGMAEPLKASVKKLGFRLRDYVPVGELIPGMAYLVRRLLENTSNESWLRAKFAEGATVEKLLAAPTPGGRQTTHSGYPAAGVPRCEPAGKGAFWNESLTDFAEPEHVVAMKAALERVRGQLGGQCPLVINGEDVWPGRALKSVNPANPDELISTAAAARHEDAQRAIDAAAAAFPAWRDTPAAARARILFDTAELLRKERHELSALMVLEAGKQWREADGDVAEAIDFLDYYGREMVRLSGGHHIDLPGESNHYFYQPRGIAAVIAPWNFPLAILCGMTAAALVTGNCAIMKPAEQTPTIALRLMRAFQKAGMPPGVCQYLPGVGEEVGAYLVEHPKVDIIAFTGSMDVGLSILRASAVVRPGQRGVKRVITELGGKNAIIVDSDADLDMAVAGTVKSAFGFQGQKCSACSRVIVLAHNHDTFVDRLVEATRSLTVAPAEVAASKIGPVIDEVSQRRILRTIEAASETLEVALTRTDLPSKGYWVPPTIFKNVPVEHTIAQDEIFGPVLAVMKARDFDEALSMALSTRFALTGGLFSRSPLNIERTREEFRVGNLYINRGTTGALVNRQAFGGFGMSGIGSKAGGPDYLLQFMEPRVVTENTIRRGFAPES